MHKMFSPNIKRGTERRLVCERTRTDGCPCDPPRIRGRKERWLDEVDISSSSLELEGETTRVF